MSKNPDQKASIRANRDVIMANTIENLTVGHEDMAKPTTTAVTPDPSVSSEPRGAENTTKFPGSKIVRLLHLSDLHRDVEMDFSPAEVVETLLADVNLVLGSGSQAAVDVVVISGDMVQHGNSQREYEQTEELLSCLYGQLFPDLAATGDKSRLVLVPGNHDVDHEQCERAIAGFFDETKHESGIHNKQKKGTIPIYFKRREHRRKFANFAKLLKSQTGKDWPEDFDQQFLDYPVLQPEEGSQTRGLVFLGLNSAYLVRNDRNDAGLDPEAMAASRSLLKSSYPTQDWVRVLVQHHPISSADPSPSDHVEYLGVSALLRDVSLVMHGHAHRHVPQQQAHLGGGNVPCIAAGTLFAQSRARQDAIDYGCNIIQLDLGTLQATIYPRTRGGLGQPWRADNRWTGDDSTSYSRVLHEPQYAGSGPPPPPPPSPDLTAHPDTPFNHHVQRTTLFEPFLKLAQRRDIVFAIGGAGSGLKTFLDQFRDYLKVKFIHQYSAADLDLATFELIRIARKARNAAFREIAQNQDDDQLDLKCLMADLAYATYHALREEFAAAIDELVPAEYQQSPVLFAEYYFANSGAMSKADLAPIIQYFFETIQRFAEVTECKPVVVFMPWQALSLCFEAPSKPLEEKAARDFWDALASFASEASPGVGFDPTKRQPKRKQCYNRYDRVCVIVAGTRVPVGRKPYKKSLVVKSIWQIPPLDTAEVKYLLGEISATLATDKIANMVIDWTAGAPWFVRLLMTYLGHRQAAVDRQMSELSDQDILDLFTSSVQGAKFAISGNPTHLPDGLQDFITQHVGAVRDNLTGGDAATDPGLVKRWNAPLQARMRGFDITSPRVEAWISSGLVWFKGSEWDVNAEDHIFRDYPIVYFRKAGRLPVTLYNTITDANVRHESDL